MKTKTPTKQQDNKIEFLYDVTSVKTNRQGEAVLVALVETFKEHLQSKRMEIKSEEKHLMMHITIILSSALRYDVIKDIAQAINIAAYYALNPQMVGEFFVEYAEASGNINEEDDEYNYETQKNFD